MSKKYNLDKESAVTDEKIFINRRKIMASVFSFPFIFNTNMLSASTKRLTFRKDLEYSTNEQTNTLKIPFRFYPCLAAGLAYYISIKRAPNKVQLLKAVYEEEFERAMTEDRDRSSFQVAPSLDYYAVY